MEEIQAKMVPETVLTNVSWFRRSRRVTAEDVLVYDHGNGYAGEPLAHAEAIRSTDRHCLVPHLCLLVEQSYSKPFPYQSQDRFDVHDRDPPRSADLSDRLID